jgi:hypothetical protein
MSIHYHRRNKGGKCDKKIKKARAALTCTGLKRVNLSGFTVELVPVERIPAAVRFKPYLHIAFPRCSDRRKPFTLRCPVPPHQNRIDILRRNLIAIAYRIFLCQQCKTEQGILKRSKLLTAGRMLNANTSDSDQL